MANPSVPVNHPYTRGGDPARPQSPYLGFRRAGQCHFWMICAGAAVILQLCFKDSSSFSS
jgi:hypothetical protein